jgi:hypothetical protein
VRVRKRLALLVSGLVLVAISCKNSATPSSGVASTSSSLVPQSVAARRPDHEPLTHERVEIPEGAFTAGSVPGEPGRNPELEPRSYSVELGPFEIDRLPFPNEPGKPPLTSVTREDAQRSCAERDARLCTELEWERACKGPRSEPYAAGKQWDQRCAREPESCASVFDVLAMGALREWVASDILPTTTDIPRRAAVRGAPKAASASEHRCAHRSGIDAATRSEDLGFRCCKGPPNAAIVREPKLGQTFSKARINAGELEKLLLADDRTRALAKAVKFFREPDAANTVLERGPGDQKGFLFSVAPLLWNPVAGAEFLLVCGRSGEDTSFVLTFHVLGEKSYKLASSFVMQNEPGPVAFAYSGYIRPRLHFSTCWGCPGETGKILYRDPDSVIIVQP